MTDSPYIALKCIQPFSKPMSHMTIVGKSGFSLYINGKYLSMFTPTYDDFIKANSSGYVSFGGIKSLEDYHNQVYSVEIRFPLYSDVCAVEVGFKKGCTIKSADEYKKKGKLVFYGSSVTQGACVSKPGDDYVSLLSSRLDIDFLNLGFSGSAKAEDDMISYISSIKASAYIFEYDYNSPSVEHLRKTHYRLYSEVRRKNPKTPIILMTKPTADLSMSEDDRERFLIIKRTYDKAIENGDENVRFINLHGCLFDENTNQYGTVDNVHPDSFGFVKMAEKIYNILNNMLNKGEKL